MTKHFKMSMKLTVTADQLQPDIQTYTTWYIVQQLKTPDISQKALKRPRCILYRQSPADDLFVIDLKGFKYAASAIKNSCFSFQARMIRAQVSHAALCLETTASLRSQSSSVLDVNYLLPSC